MALSNELIQVVLNILNNAKDELLKLERREDLYIFVSMEKVEDILKISIKDNAGGIPPDLLDRIFEPYFTTKHKAQGTGIGLFMSQEIIKKHMRGTLHASNKSFEYENKKYLGALFSLEIPLDN